MGPKKRRHNSSRADSECIKKLNLLHVCGHCSKIVGDDEELHLKHALSHKIEITQCRTCCIPIKLCDVDEHLRTIHSSSYRQIKLNIDESLIELRIAAGKSYSNFWGIRISSNDPLSTGFSSTSKRWWKNFKSGRSLGCFRVMKSKFHWKCPICADAKLSSFNETISMRLYAVAHLENYHRDEILPHVPAFLEFEYHHLQEELDFDVRSLMHIANQKKQILYRSFNTFYTINLKRLENGEKFLTDLKKKNGFEEDEVRYCLVCCCLVPVKSIRRHFLSPSHSNLNAVAESTSFVQVHEKKEDRDVAEEEGSNKGDKAGKERLEDNAKFEFPRELFLYTKVFKTVRIDEFKWRCCLCPRAHAQKFATQIIMRMYALRHIDEKHKFLFTEEFIEYEWNSLKHEMRASFDIRTFTPLQYTLKGESTFNNRDPNDYVLPQQYYFLTKELLKDTVICGFCYRSLSHIDFPLHISVHGFPISEKVSCLRPTVLNGTVQQLMDEGNYSKPGLDDEFHEILTIAGKRLKSKMELLNESRVGNSRSAEFNTPVKSERDTDGEYYTPRSRKSALDARKLLAETFNVLKNNARNRNDTWNESSSSSSSDDDNSDDDRFEKALDLEATTISERLERSKSAEAKKIDVSKMKPSEIRGLIQKEAKKKGIAWPNSSSDSSSESEKEEEEKSMKEVGNKWDRMTPHEIRQLIQKTAEKRRIKLSFGSSSSSDNDE